MGFECPVYPVLGESVVLLRVFACLFLATTCCNGLAPGPVQAQEPIKISLSGPLTSGSSFLGAGLRDGARLAAEEINAADGIDVGGMKRPILLTERDDQALFPMAAHQDGGL